MHHFVNVQVKFVIISNLHSFGKVSIEELFQHESLWFFLTFCLQRNRSGNVNLENWKEGWVLLGDSVRNMLSIGHNFVFLLILMLNMIL